MRFPRTFLAAAAAALILSGPVAAGPRKTNDRILPNVLITSPTTGQTVHGTLPVTVQASDNVALRSVALFLDGYFIDSRAVAPYTLTFASARCIPGLHTLQAQATDTSGNTRLSVPVTVNVIPPLPGDDIQPPTGTQIVSPYANQVVSGIVPITVSTTDNVGVAYVELYIGSNLPIKMPYPNFTYSWNTTGLAAGSFHHIQAVAYDASYNYQSSSLITVQIAR